MESLILYKYQPIKEYVLESLRNNEFCYSFPEDFNDPFDCDFNSYYEGTRKEWIDFIESANVNSCIKKTKLKELEKLNFDNKKINEKFPFKISSKNKFILNCFSSKNNDILMWSHYADKHRGICVGYNTININNGLFFKMEEEMIKGKKEYGVPVEMIVYSMNYLKPYNGLIEDEMRILDFFKVKYNEWKYEQEYRSFLYYPYYNKQKFKFKKEILSEIIFGLNTSDSNINEIKNIVYDNYIILGVNVKFYKTNKVKNKYEMEILKL